MSVPDESGAPRTVDVRGAAPSGPALCRLAGLITVTSDGEEFVLGRPDLGNYVAVPEPGAVFVTTLAGGGSLAEATRRAGDVAGEPVDGDDFLLGLVEAGLLDPVGAQAPGAGGHPRRKDRRRQIRWIEGIDARSARRLFGAPAWICYGVCAIFAAGVLIGRPDLRPSWESLWFVPDPVLCVVALLPVQLMLGALHESWHWLAGRAAGVPAVFRVSYRGIFVVFETDLSQIVTVPRAKRYGPFLAGVAVDSVILAIALGIRLGYHTAVISVPPLVDRLLGAIVLGQAVSLAVQVVATHARSDGYAVIANALRCHNLYRATWLTTKARLWPLTAGERAEWEQTGERDRAVARWFSVVYLAGMLAMGWLLLHVGLPSATAMVAWVAPNLASLALDTAAFWESVVVLGYIAVQFGLPPVLALRERRLRKADVLR